MLTCAHLLLVALAASFVSSSSSSSSSSPSASSSSNDDLFENQLGDIGFCKRQCHGQLADTDSILSACHRGCRLFSICQFVNGDAGVNASKEECEGACQEAYRRPAEQEGCRRGCENQPTEAEIHKRRLKALMRRPKPLSVMEMLSGWCSDLLSSAQSFISSTWTFYLQADDGKVVVFQTQPQVEFSLPELPAARPDVPIMASTPRPRVGPRERADKARVGGKGKHGAQRGEPPQPAEHDFLGCMSRRSGLPRWILAACLFLSIVVMLWLSCASLVTAPDQRVKTQLSINGDKEFLDDMKKVSPYPLSPVIAVSIGQSDESLEAGPLPVKVDLDKSVL